MPPSAIVCESFNLKVDNFNLVCATGAFREGELRPAKQVGETRGLLDLVEEDYLLEDQKKTSSTA